MNSDSILQNSNDRDTVKETLRALFPEDGLRVNCMLMAYDEGIHTELKATENITIAWVNDKADLLIREYGISKENAQTAIINWTKLIASPQLQALLEQKRINEYFVIKDKMLFKCSSKLNRYLTIIESVYPECFSHQTSGAAYEEAAYNAINKCLEKMRDLLRNVVSMYFGLDGKEFATQEDISSYIRENAGPQEEDEDIDSLSCEELFQLFFGNAMRRMKHWLISETREIRGFKPSTYNIEKIIKQDLHNQLHLSCSSTDQRLLYRAYKISPEFDDIEELELQPRIIRCLKRNGITTVGQLMLVDLPTLCSVRNLGKKAIEEIINLQHKLYDSKTTIAVIHLEIHGKEWKFPLFAITEDDLVNLIYEKMQTLGTFISDDVILILSEKSCVDLLNLGYLYSEQVVRDYIYLKESLPGLLPELIAELEDSIKRPLIIGIESEKAEWFNKHVDQIIDSDIMRSFPYDVSEYPLLSQYIALHEQHDDLSSYFKLAKDSNDITIWANKGEQKTCDRDQCTLRFSESITVNLITEKRLHSIRLVGKECPECGKKYIVRDVLRRAIAKEFSLPYTEDMDYEADLLLPFRTYNCLKRAGIRSIFELSNYTLDDMMKVRNLGRKSLEEVIELMAINGISFKDNDRSGND